MAEVVEVADNQVAVNINVNGAMVVEHPLLQCGQCSFSTTSVSNYEKHRRRSLNAQAVNDRITWYVRPGRPAIDNPGFKCPARPTGFWGTLAKAGTWIVREFTG